jgi:hypothetical protein
MFALADSRQTLVRHFKKTTHLAQAVGAFLVLRMLYRVLIEKTD